MIKSFKSYNILFFKKTLINYFVLVFFTIIIFSVYFYFFEIYVLNHKYSKIVKVYNSINNGNVHEFIKQNLTIKHFNKKNIKIEDKNALKYCKKNGKVTKVRDNGINYFFMSKEDNEYIINLYVDINSEIKFINKNKQLIGLSCLFILFFYVIYSNLFNYINYKTVNKLISVIKNNKNNYVDEKLNLNYISHDYKNMTFLLHNLLMEFNRMKNEQKKFISLVSHEVRTPIAIMQGYIEIIEGWGYDDEKIFKESVVAIKQEIMQLNSLIEKILFLARKENEVIKLKKKTINIGKVLENEFKKMQILDSYHKYEYNIELKKDDVIIGDKKLLEQLILVILENSAKYIEQGKIISGKIYSNDINIIIELQDNGNGIPDNEINYIFDKYYGINNETACKTKGLGLGLTTAKIITELHNGKIEINSNENIGTLVKITLPKKLEL